MKKANITITQFIMLVIFLFLLFIVVVYLAGPGQEVIEKLKILLPSFGFLFQEKNETLIIGYNVYQDKPKYYDGLSWQEFEKTLKYNKKEILSQNARKFFIEYYYNSTNLETKSFPLSEQAINEIKTNIYQENDFPAFYCFKLMKGSILNILNFLRISQETPPGIQIDLVSKVGKSCTDDSFGSFILNADGKMKFFGIDKKEYITNRKKNFGANEIDIEKNSQLYNEVKEKTDDWRDSVLQHSMFFKFDNDDKEYYFCVTKTPFVEKDGKPTIILSIDLSKPIEDKNKKCFQD